MSVPLRRLCLLLVSPAMVVIAAACGDGTQDLPSVQLTVVPSLSSEVASATPVPATATPTGATPAAGGSPGPATTPSPSAAAATPLPAAPVAPTTAPPNPPQSTSNSGAIEFKPAQLVQGGTAFIYLNLPATSATARFGDKQYPMLHDGKRWWAIVGVGALAAPGLAPVTITYTPQGRQDSVSVTQSITIADRDFPVERIDLPPSTAALLAPEIVQNELAQRAGIYSGFTAQRLWSGPFQLPNKGPIGDGYGTGRSYNGAPVTDYHRGTDFTADTGAPAIAVAAGRVVFTGELRVRGNAVIVDHGAGVFTAYHHLSAIKATQGQLVAAGEVVGDVGMTGLATGPHLHWELVVRGVEVDGALWLKGQEMAP